MNAFVCVVGIEKSVSHVFAMCLPCVCHAVFAMRPAFMQCGLLSHAIYHVLAMGVPCIGHALAMGLPCMCHALAMLLSTHVPHCCRASCMCVRLPFNLPFVCHAIWHAWFAWVSREVPTWLGNAVL